MVTNRWPSDCTSSGETPPCFTCSSQSPSATTVRPQDTVGSSHYDISIIRKPYCGFSGSVSYNALCSEHQNNLSLMSAMGIHWTSSLRYAAVRVVLTARIRIFSMLLFLVVSPVQVCAGQTQVRLVRAAAVTEVVSESQYFFCGQHGLLVLYELTGRSFRVRVRCGCACTLLVLLLTVAIPITTPAYSV